MAALAATEAFITVMNTGLFLSPWLCFQGLQRKLTEALEGHGKAAEVQEGFTRLQEEHAASVAALAVLEAAHGEAEKRHSAQIMTLEKQLHSTRAEATDLSSQLNAAQTAKAGSRDASERMIADKNDSAASVKAIAELKKELEGAVRAKAALQLAKDGAGRELASVKDELAALRQKQTGPATQDAAAHSREVSTSNAADELRSAEAAAPKEPLMPKLAAAAEASKQVEVLDGKLAGAQVRLCACCGMCYLPK